MSNEKPVVNYVSQPAPVVPAPVVDTNSPAFQAAVDAAVARALQNANVPVAQPDARTEALAKFAEVMMAKEQREGKDQHEKELRIAQKQVQAGKNAQSNEHEVREKQKRCKHVKGGKLQKPGQKDFDWSMHTFPNAKRRLRCNQCGFTVHEKDTNDYIIRDGRRYRNHVGIGWREAFIMLGQSSNQASTSEVILNINPDSGQVLSAEDQAALQARKQAEADLYSTPVPDAEVAKK